MEEYEEDEIEIQTKASKANAKAMKLLGRDHRREKIMQTLGK